jgi:gliding motility-associated protein GldE
LESEYHLSLFNQFSGLNGTPDSNMITDLLILLLLLIGSAMMSASETAYFSLRQSDLKKLRSNKSKQAKTALSLYNYPEKLLSTILVTNNIINIAFVLLAVYTGSVLFNIRLDHITVFILELLVITFLLLLFGEVMPKIYASKNSLAAALFMAPLLTFLQKALTPLTFLLIRSANFARNRHTAKNGENSEKGFSSESLNEDEKILKGIANFGNINVSAIMCPRINVTAIDIKSGFDKIIPLIINSGFSRIPVYSGSFDSVKGILYAKDVLPYTNYPASFKWQSLLRPSYFVPETKKINDLLKEFQLRKIHMAIVIDEYGGTSGIVTLEDILEEIVGEITDESDEVETMFRKIDETTYIFEGRILIHDFCKIFKIDEEQFAEVRGESETLAGLMLELTGEIPQKDQVIRFGNFTFKIESVDKRRIKEIKVEFIKKAENVEKD